MTKKIENTFAKALEQVETLQKVFRQNGKLESAMMESSTDISSLAAINSAFETLKQVLSTSTTLTEGVLDSDDDDGFMARSQLYFMARDAIQLHGMIDDRDNLPGWVQSKISQSAEAIDAVRRYTEYNAMKADTPAEMPQQDVSEGKYKNDAQRKAVHAAKSEKANESTLSEHELSLLTQIVDQMNKDASAGDYTAIDELLKDIPAEKLEAFLSQLDEGMGKKLGTYALAAMLGLGAVKGIDATSAKHSPLGQALDHAAETWSGPEAAEALKLYKNIDLYVDENPSALRYWASQNQDLIAKFKESTVYESSLQDKLMNDAKEMDMDDFVAHAVKHGMKMSDAYGMWDDMNPYDEDHIEPFSDDDYDEFGVRHSTSFNMPPKGEGIEEAEQKPYVCVHAKKGKYECHAGSSYEAAKKAAAHWKMKSTAGIDAHLAVEEGFKIRDKSRGYGVSDKTYKTREEAKKAAIMKAAETGGDWEVLEEGMEFDEKRNDALKQVASDMFKHAKAAAKKKVK